MYVLLLALVVPAASGLVDCRSACHSCRENKEVPAMVEVYCSMCEECKERRRDKFTATSTTTHHDETINFLPERVSYEEFPPPTTEPYIFGPTTDNIIEKMKKQFATADGYPFGHFTDEDRRKDDRRRGRYKARQWARQALEEYEASSEEHYHRLRPEDIPEGCPTPPVCSEDEEPLHVVQTIEPTTTTTTTTTTKKPCPPIRPCRKKRKRPTRQPCCMPCMPMCPYPMPMMCPGQQCCQPCPGQQGGQSQPYQETTNSALSKSTTPSNDYIYMYVGVPKNIIKH